MTAVTHLKVRQGSEYGVRWPVSPDPTGATVRAQVRARVSDPTVLHEWSSTAGNATVAADGVTLLVPAAVSSAWTFKKGVYDVELTLPSGETHRIAEGKIEVLPEVTR